MPCAYAVLAVVSNCYPPVWGRLPTRYSPVRHSVTKSSFRGNLIKCFVRLACVKHAASVHPEPGSNSHVKKFSCPVINWLNQTCIWFTVLRLFLYIETFVCCDSQHPEIHWIFQGYFTVQLSMFFVSFLSTARLLYLIKPVLSRTFLFCFVESFLSNSLSILTHPQSFVKGFFELIFQASGEGGIWTLAPLLTTCTLSRGVPSASLGTSPNQFPNY